MISDSPLWLRPLEVGETVVVKLNTGRPGRTGKVVRVRRSRVDVRLYDSGTVIERRLGEVSRP